MWLCCLKIWLVWEPKKQMRGNAQFGDESYSLLEVINYLRNTLWGRGVWQNFTERFSGGRWWVYVSVNLIKGYLTQNSYFKNVNEKFCINLY